MGAHMALPRNADDDQVLESPGIDGIPAEMIKDHGDLLESCLLLLFNCMPASQFP